MYILFVFLNILGLYLCYLDKRKAIQHKRRIPERVLLVVSLVGGAFGFFLGMHLFHHKTKHWKFLILEPFFMALWILFILLERGIL